MRQQQQPTWQEANAVHIGDDGMANQRNEGSRSITHSKWTTLDRSTRSSPRVFPMLINPEQLKPPRNKNVNYSGWRAGLLSCFLTALLVLVVNFAFLMWASSKPNMKNTFGVLFQGNCATAKARSTALHVAINILSTILLSACNYVMQCLNSPTRGDINRAHAEKVWLDIGVPSWRNLRWIGRRNRTLWWLLGLSSIPLHFLYNSTVFLDLGGQQYQVRVTNSSIEELQMIFPQPKDFIGMTWAECEETYRKSFVFGNGDIYIVAPDRLNQDTGYMNRTYQTTLSMDVVAILEYKFVDLGQTCYWDDTSIPTSNSPYGKVALVGNNKYWKYTACYSEKRAEYCRIRFNLGLLTLVLLCMFSKTICMALALKSREPCLATLGDAITSFLDDPDPTTAGLCIASQTDFEVDIWKQPGYALKWTPGLRTRLSTLKGKRWMIVNLIFLAGTLITMSLAVVLYTAQAQAESGLSRNIEFESSLKSMPPLASGLAIPGTWGQILNTLIVNAPQSVVSIMNVLYNSMFTCMLIGEEWNALALRRQSLRVTLPRGAQKSKYYLTIPYRYAIPVMLLSFALHYLISESLFLVRITAIYHDQVLDDKVSSIGYSSFAIALSCLACFSMLAFGTMKGLRSFHPAAPMVGACSAAISAACHPSKEEGDISTKMVQWGVVQGAGDSIGSWKNIEKDFGHCSFSSRQVAPPIPGRYYAGDVSHM